MLSALTSRIRTSGKKKKKCESTSKSSFNQNVFGVKVDSKTLIKIRQVYIAFETCYFKIVNQPEFDFDNALLRVSGA